MPHLPNGDGSSYRAELHGVHLGDHPDQLRRSRQFPFLVDGSLPCGGSVRKRRPAPDAVSHGHSLLVHVLAWRAGTPGREHAHPWLDLRIFLFTFGKAVEARMGKAKYLGFYILSGILAAVVHIASDPASAIPTLGASGAIAGVLGGYLILWPKAEITGLVLPFLIVRIRAYWFLIAWLVMQFIPILQMGNNLAGAGVAYWAHIGGFIAGIAMAAIVKLLQPNSEVCYIPDDCPPCEADHVDSTKQ